MSSNPQIIQVACASRTRHARSPRRVARAPGKAHSRLHFAHSTRAISAEGRAHTGHIALSPAFRVLDTHDLRRGLHFRLTLFVPPSAFKERICGEMFFIGTSPVKVFNTHTCILALGYVHLHYLHLDTYTCILALGCFHSYTSTGILTLTNFHLDTSVPL